MKNKHSTLLSEVVLNGKRIIAICGIAWGMGNMDCGCCKKLFGSGTNNGGEEPNDEDKTDNIFVNDNEEVVSADNHKDENETKKEKETLELVKVWKLVEVGESGCTFMDGNEEKHYVEYGTELNVKVTIAGKVNEKGDSFSEVSYYELKLAKNVDGDKEKITVKMINEGGHVYFDSKNKLILDCLTDAGAIPEDTSSIKYDSETGLIESLHTKYEIIGKVDASVSSH